MPDVGNPRPERTTKEHLVEAGFVAAALLPLAVLSAPVGWWLERRHEFSARHRHGISLGCVAVAAGALMIMGLPDYASAWAGLLSDLVTGQASELLTDLLRLAAVGLPAGVGLGMLARRAYEWALRRHPIHGPMASEARRARRHEALAKIAREPDTVPLLSEGLPVLGPWLDGDPGSEAKSGSWAVVPDSAFHVLAVGATGAGKSVMIERLVMAALRRGERIVFLDGKQSATSGSQLAAKARAVGVPADRIRLWPESGPIDLLLGQPQEVLDRVHAMSTFGEPYYETVARSALRLAVDHPKGQPRTFGELMARLDLTALKATFAGTPMASVVASLNADLVGGIRLRYHGLEAALAKIGAISSDPAWPGWTWEDADVSYISLPTATAPVVAAGFGRSLLLDLLAYQRDPNRRHDPRPMLLVIEELGALLGDDPTMARGVVEMLERARSAGCRVVISGQSMGSFGDEATARRLWHSGASALVMRCSDAELPLELVGTRPQHEASLAVYDDGRLGVAGSVRVQHAYAVSPDSIRQAPVGRCWLFHRGTFTMAQVAPLTDAA